MDRHFWRLHYRTFFILQTFKSRTLNFFNPYLPLIHFRMTHIQNDVLVSTKCPFDPWVFYGVRSKERFVIQPYSLFKLHFGIILKRNQIMLEEIENLPPLLQEHHFHWMTINTLFYFINSHLKNVSSHIEIFNTTLSNCHHYHLPLKIFNTTV